MQLSQLLPLEHVAHFNTDVQFVHMLVFWFKYCPARQDGSFDDKDETFDGSGFSDDSDGSKDDGEYDEVVEDGVGDGDGEDDADGDGDGDGDDDVEAS